MPDDNPLASNPQPNREIKCVVSCQAADGRPSFCLARIRCTQKQYDDGVHYAAAREACDEQGYTSIGLVYDQDDGPDWLHRQFDWSGVEVRSVGLKQPHLYRLLLNAASSTGKFIPDEIKDQLDQIATAIQESDSVGDEDDESCDECGAAIPATPGGSLPNKHHHDSCSLYDSRKP